MMQVFACVKGTYKFLGACETKCGLQKKVNEAEKLGAVCVMLNGEFEGETFKDHITTIECLYWTLLREKEYVFEEVGDTSCVLELCI